MIHEKCVELSKCIVRVKKSRIRLVQKTFIICLPHRVYRMSSSSLIHSILSYLRMIFKKLGYNK